MMSAGTEWNAMTGRRRLHMGPVTDRAAMWSFSCWHLQGQRDQNEGEEGPSDPKGLLLPLVLLFSSAVTRAFPWPIKEKANRPMERIDPSRTDRITPNRSEHEINTQEHDMNTQLSSDWALNTCLLFPPEAWDHFPLSPICTPYYKLAVLVTRTATTN